MYRVRRFYVFNQCSARDRKCVGRKRTRSVIRRRQNRVTGFRRRKRDFGRRGDRNRRYTFYIIHRTARRRVLVRLCFRRDDRLLTELFFTHKRRGERICRRR